MMLSSKAVCPSVATASSLAPGSRARPDQRLPRCCAGLRSVAAAATGRRAAAAATATRPAAGTRQAALLACPSLQRPMAAQRRAAMRQRLAVCASAASGSSGSKILTLPTILTLARVAAVPGLVAAWFCSAPWAPAACTVLFVGASLTDYLDGYLARKMNASSAFGAFLDPVADKLMVATLMILMCTRPLPAGVLAGNTWLMPVVTCVVIGREITMSALREWAAALGPEAHSAVAVSWVGKWKTATQMASLTLLALAHQGASAGVGSVWGVPPQLLQAAGAGGVPLLLVAAVLTAWSLALYFKGLWRFF